MTTVAHKSTGLSCYAPLLQDLTPQAIRKWAGAKIAARGNEYWETGAVSDLVKLENGGLLATVSGNDEYITAVTPAPLGLHSACTCPYDGGDCKHAVALQSPTGRRGPMFLSLGWSR